jgi:Membrane carboxypeptidase (penicillin-binding protein)
MSVRVGQFAGLDQVQKIATTLNLCDKAPHGPAIYIGSFETNLKDLTTAYSAFPNAGVANKVISSSALMIRIISRFIEPPSFRPSA